MAGTAPLVERTVDRTRPRGLDTLGTAVGGASGGHSSEVVLDTARAPDGGAVTVLAVLRPIKAPSADRHRPRTPGIAGTCRL